MSTLVSVVGIPLYRLVIVKVIPRLKNVRMLTKMWMGLYLSLLQVVLYVIVVVNHDTAYWQQHHSVIPNGNTIILPVDNALLFVLVVFLYLPQIVLIASNTMTQLTTPTCGSSSPSSSMVSLLCLSP